MPLVRASAHLLAELDVQILRSDEVGNIVTNNGDLDNRLKTLFDGLRSPVATDNGTIPPGTPEPFYSLLEDDFLISRLSIAPGPLLIPPQNDTDPKAWVNAIVTVTISASKRHMANLEFLS